MTINGQNFEIYQGDNKELIITVRNDDGSLTDLAGYNAVWCVYSKTPEPNNIVLQKTTSPGEGISIPSPSSGELHITLEQEDTHLLTPKNYGHQCEIEDSFGNHATVTTGYVKVLRSVTHPIF